VREFRVGLDVFATLHDGEAVIYTTLGPAPARAQVLRVTLDDRRPPRIGDCAQHRCETLCHPELTLAHHTHAPSSGKQPPSNDLGDLGDL
jgi:hypothetical protein